MRPPKRAVPRVAIFTSQNQIQSTELSLPPFSFRKWLSWVYWKFVRFNQPWGTGESFDPPGEWTFEAPPDLWRLPHTMSNMTTGSEKWPMYTLCCDTLLYLSYVLYTEILSFSFFFQHPPKVAKRQRVGLNKNQVENKCKIITIFESSLDAIATICHQVTEWPSDVARWQIQAMSNMTTGGIYHSHKNCHF